MQQKTKTNKVSLSQYKKLQTENLNLKKQIAELQTQLKNLNNFIGGNYESIEK